MAVEATRFNLFPQQLLQERDLMTPPHQGNGFSVYNEPQMRFPATPLPPGNHYFYNQEVVYDTVPAKTSWNTESGLTCNIPATRKRCRDSAGGFYASPDFSAAQKNNFVSQVPSLVGEDVLPQFRQLEIDAIISQHTKRIKLAFQERQKRQAKLLVASIEEGAVKILKEKDDQILKMVKLNFILQERAKTLYVENQLWRDLAQTNEATAISLRTNLEQALARIGGVERVSAGVGGGAVVDEEEAESCCGGGDQGMDMEGGESCYSDRRCRQCGEREACVLLLPCRHLCLCNVCGSGPHQRQKCPVCNSSMNATLHVNMY